MKALVLQEIRRVFESVLQHHVTSKECMHCCVSEICSFSPNVQEKNRFIQSMKQHCHFPHTHNVLMCHSLLLSLHLFLIPISVCRAHPYVRRIIARKSEETDLSNPLLKHTVSHTESKATSTFHLLSPHQSLFPFISYFFLSSLSVVHRLSLCEKPLRLPQTLLQGSW